MADTQPVRTVQYARKKERILETAAAVFNEKGLAGTAMVDIAGRIGLVTNSVTYYFKTKEDLAAACLLRSIETLAALLEKHRHVNNREARLQAFLRSYFETVARIELGQHPDFMRFGDLRALVKPQSDTVFPAYEALFKEVRRFLYGTRLSPEGRRSRNAGTHLFLTVLHASRYWFHRYEPSDWPRVAAQFADILIGGIGKHDARWTAGHLPEFPEKRNAGSQDTILHSAIVLLNEYGYRGASIDQIAARLSVTKGAFYHHYENKDDVVAACFNYSFDVVRHFQLASEAMAGTCWDRLCATASELVRRQLSTPGPLLRISAFNALPEDLRIRTRATMDRLIQRFAGTISDGIVDGSIRPVDPFIAAGLVYAAVNGTSELDRWLVDPTPDAGVALYLRPLFKGLYSEHRTAV